MSSPPSDSHNPPQSNPVDDPLTSEPETLATLSTPFDSRKLFWRNVISLSWRCLATALALAFLIIGLRIFSGMGQLSRMEQRGFNTITILLGASASLGIGSMLGNLGSMLRWRLLARKKYKMQDVELVLAMQSPSGSAKLLIAHFREWRFSLTTLIVMLYLLMNVTGRFSVAIFGLTYNLVDQPDLEMPPTPTNWTSTVLLAKNATDFNEIEKLHGLYMDFVRGELAESINGPHIGFDNNVPQALNPQTYQLLATSSSLPKRTDGGVRFEYYIADHPPGWTSPERPAHAVHSIASCTMLHLDGNKYWKDYGNANQTSKEWEDERNGEVIAEVLRVLDNRNVWPRQDAEHVTWAAPLARESNGSSVTYVVYRETAWECISNLSETLHGNPHPTPLFDPATLFLLPIVEREEPGGRAALTGHMGNFCGGASVGGTSSIVYKSFTDLKSLFSPSVGVQTLNFYQNGTGGSATQKDYYNLYVAALVARLPIAAIAWGNKRLPGLGQDFLPNFRMGIETTLEVKWNRVAIVAGSIVAGQILAITVVLYYCRNVYVREDTYLTTAELLKSVLSKIEDGDTMTAKELGDSLDRVLEGPVSYGTIPGAQGDRPRVALGLEVDYNFPGFPPFRKGSAFLP